jgi:hypothetical protein
MAYPTARRETLNTPELIAALDAEISRLQQARKLLSGTRRRGGKRAISAEGRARISPAMKKRWAQKKMAAKG